ncbi:MAG: hypothetical protein ACRCXZ_00080 [Patescibacteria group bacterium]
MWPFSRRKRAKLSEPLIRQQAKNKLYALKQKRVRSYVEDSGVDLDQIDVAQLIEFLEIDFKGCEDYTQSVECDYTSNDSPFSSSSDWNTITINHDQVNTVEDRGPSFWESIGSVFSSLSDHNSDSSTSATDYSSTSSNDSSWSSSNSSSDSSWSSSSSSSDSSYSSTSYDSSSSSSYDSGSSSW